MQRETELCLHANDSMTCSILIYIHLLKLFLERSSVDYYLPVFPSASLFFREIPSLVYNTFYNTLFSAAISRNAPFSRRSFNLPEKEQSRRRFALTVARDNDNREWLTTLDHGNLSLQLIERAINYAIANRVYLSALAGYRD